MEANSFKSVIISSKPGQLGNMLFLFTHFIVFGIERGIDIKAPAFEEYAGYFNSTRKSLIASYPQSNSTIRSKWLRKLMYRMSYLFAKIVRRSGLNNSLLSSIYVDWNESLNLEDETNQKFFNSRYIFIQGWLYRSGSLIQKHKGMIVNFFKPADVHLININNIIKPGTEILVGVHIRQGDYKTFEGGKYFFEMPQYITLMKKVLTLLTGKKVVFLICSNSGLSHEPFCEMPHIFGTGKEIEDLYAFAKCNYLIGPPSTFTMWASFYGDVPLYQVHNLESTFMLEDFKVVLD